MNQKMSSSSPADACDNKVGHPVFIHTSFDTRLILMLSDSDTASDFEKKIMLAHHKRYPAIGEIKVEALKVKRGGKFFELTESVHVKSLFEAKTGSWFMSVDASCVNQNDGVQHLGKYKAGDQLALQWATHSRSVERLEDHGSPSNPSKTVPFVNQKAVSVGLLTSGDSFKDISKNVEEDMADNDKPLDNEPQEKLYTVNTDNNSKKRKPDVDSESLLKDNFVAGPSVKKKHKTRVKTNVQASKDKDLSDENNVTRQGGNCSKEMSIGIAKKKKESELVQKPAMENEIHASLMNVGSNSQQCAGDQIDNQKGDLEVSLEQRPEVKLHQNKEGITGRENIDEGKRRKSKKPAVKKTYESLHKHADNHVTDVSSTVLASVIDEGRTDEVSNNALVDANNGDDVIMKEVEVAVENVEEKSGKEITYTNDVVTVTNEENNNADNLEKQNEKTDYAKKQKKKRKSKVSAARNEDESVTKHVNGDILVSVIDERKTDEVSEKSLVDANKGDEVIMKVVGIAVENIEVKTGKEVAVTNDVAAVTNEQNLVPRDDNVVNNDDDNLEKQNEKVDDTKKQKTRKTKKAISINKDESIAKHVSGDICDDLIVKDMELSVENTEEQPVKEVTDANDVATVVTNEEYLLPHNESVTNNDADNLQRLNEKVDDMKKEKTKRKTKKSVSRKKDESVTLPKADGKDGDEMIENNAEIGNERLAGKANKSNQSQYLLSKRQSAEVELDKSQTVDHHHPPEDALKTMTMPEVSKDNIGVDFMDHFSPGQQTNKTAMVDNRKVMKKAKDDSKNNNRVSATLIKDSKRTKKIDAQKTNKQQTVLSKPHVKTVKKQSVKSSPHVKRLLNASVTIFGDDSDNDAIVNSDSTTRTPSPSLSSSSSEESAFRTDSSSHPRRGKGVGGRNMINSQSPLKNMSMADRLKSSSSYKKAKRTASSQVEDTESQPVDFVPDSQPMAR